MARPCWCVCHCVECVYSGVVCSAVYATLVNKSSRLTWRLANWLTCNNTKPTGMVSVSSRNVVARGGGSNAMAPPPSRSGGVFAGLRSPAPHRDAGPMGPSNGMGGPFGGGLAYGSTGPSFGGPSFQPPPAAGRSFSGRAAGARIDNSIVGRRIKIARGQFRVCRHQRGGVLRVLVVVMCVVQSWSNQSGTHPPTHNHTHPFID